MFVVDSVVMREQQTMPRYFSFF